MAKIITNQNNNASFINIKSNYILKSIFENLRTKKYLEIIHYNKALQKRLNIDIDDYKKEFYNDDKIIIEIIPMEYTKAQIINLNKKYHTYCHVFFNGNKEETKRKNIIKSEKISTIKLILDNGIKNMSQLFRDRKYIKKINFIKFNRKDFVDMNGMFFGCSLLEEIKFSFFNTSNVIDMSSMFRDCSKLKELDLSSFNTEKVTNMSSMFDGCTSLYKLNISNFNTGELKDMSFMFLGCSSLIELNLSNFNTEKVTDMSYLFEYCSSLKVLNIPNFKTNNLIKMKKMFAKCLSLKEINCSNEIIKNEFNEK